jgi:hypothetical protein
MMPPLECNLDAAVNKLAELPLSDTPRPEQPVSQWYAAYTNPRHEKYVARQLDERSIDSFLPLYRSLRRWKDRRKQIELPLFPGYLRRRCACRKPGIGMLTQAASDLGLSLPDSYMVGDGLTDIEAGTRAGCNTVFVGRWKCEHCQFMHPPGLTPTFIAKDLWEAVQLIRSDLYHSEPAESYSSPSLDNLVQKIG